MGLKIESTEDDTMNPGKRPAESTDSGAIGSEKRIKASEEQLDGDGMDEEVIDVSDGEMSYYGRRRGPNYRSPGSPRTCYPPSECCFCHEVTTHMPRYCPKYPPRSPPPPPPTSEEMKNNRLYYCRLCVKYVEHDKFECPRRNPSSYRVTEDGCIEYLRCPYCYSKEVHLGEDCPDSPRRLPNYGEEDDDVF